LSTLVPRAILAERDLTIHVIERQGAINRRQGKIVMEIIDFLIGPCVILMSNVVGDVGPVLRDEQVLAKARNGFVVGEFIASIIGFSAWREDFPEQYRIQ
jgi:hypothetical protein